jgi:hypothetical protein
MPILMHLILTFMKGITTSLKEPEKPIQAIV